MKHRVAEFVSVLTRHALPLAFVIGWLLCSAARTDAQILEFIVRSMFGPSRPAQPVMELPPEIVDGQVNAYASILRERVDVERSYLEAVCELDGAARAALAAEGDRLMVSIRAELRRAIQHGGGADQGYVQISGQLVEIPSGAEERLFAVDELLAAAAGRLAANVPDKLAAERRRMADARKEAISAVWTVVVDHTVLLTSKQRRDLQDAVARNADDDTSMSLGETLIIALMNPQLAEWFYETEVAKLGLTEQRLAAILTPNQMSAWREKAESTEKFMVAPGAQGAMIVVDLDERIDLEAFKEAAAGAAGSDEAQAGEGDGDQGVEAGLELPRLPPPPPAIAPELQPRPFEFRPLDGVELKDDAAPPEADVPIDALEERVVAQAGSPSDHRDQLESLLERSLDYVDDVCSLTDAQRRKLLLAGKLDITAQLEKMAEVQKAAIEARKAAADAQEEQGEDAGVQVVEFMVDRPAPNASVFFDSSSRFGKFVRNRLSAAQTKRLDDSRRERMAHQRQAAAKAVACLLGESGKLTAAEHERVLAALQRELDDCEIELSAGPATQAVHRLASLPDEKLRPLFDARQWPVVRRHWSELRVGLLEWFGPDGQALIEGCL